MGKMSRAHIVHLKIHDFRSTYYTNSINVCSFFAHFLCSNDFYSLVFVLSCNKSDTQQIGTLTLYSRNKQTKYNRVTKLDNEPPASYKPTSKLQTYFELNIISRKMSLNHSIYLNFDRLLCQ